MKRILLLVFFSLSLAGVCQSLAPRVYGNGVDTVFAFSRLQIKAVTKLIVKGQFDAQTIRKQENLIGDLEKKNQASAQLIRNLYDEISINEHKILQRDTAITLASAVISTKDQQIQQANTQLAITEKKVRRTRRVTVVLMFISLVLGTQL